MLPDNLSELQGELGGIGECVYAGYSLIYREGLSQSFYLLQWIQRKYDLFIFILGLPTASLTFYSVNCSTGDWFV